MSFLDHATEIFRDELKTELEDFNKFPFLANSRTAILNYDNIQIQIVLTRDEEEMIEGGHEYEDDD